jgi:hypothetical protein
MREGSQDIADSASARPKENGMTRLAHIAALISCTTDRKLLRLLNRAYWQEYFRLEREWMAERKKAA